jgi:RNA polymerase sigma-70 factor (sigma-E family)
MTTRAADRALSGHALEELYIRDAPQALRLAYFLTGNRSAAEDLVQEAFVRVAGRFAHLREPDTMPAYLRRTIVNLHTSHLRRRRVEREWIRRQTPPAELERAHDPGPREELWEAMWSLSPRQRSAIVLRFYEDLSERDAAQVLGCSVGALNQLVVRALAALRRHIEREGS